MPKFPRPTSYTGSQSNQQQTGVARSATALEALNPLISDLYISPQTMASAQTLKLSSPGPIGDVTPSTGNFTTLTTTSTITSGTSLTATLGDIVATNGNVILNGAAKQLRVEGGAVTDFIGTATLVAGTVTVANTNIAANDRIFLTHGPINASAAIGELSYTISAGVSFTINALDDLAGVEPNDVSTISYFIVRQL